MSLPNGRQETDFRNAVIVAASERGVAMLWVQNAGSVELKRGGWQKLGETGMSDLIGIHTSGHLIAFEIKSPTRETTPEQINFLRRIGTTWRGIALLYRYDEDLDWDTNAAAAVDALIAKAAERTGEPS